MRHVYIGLLVVIASLNQLVAAFKIQAAKEPQQKIKDLESFVPEEERIQDKDAFIYNKWLEESGEMAAKVQMCQLDAARNLDGESFWMDNIWQEWGVRQLSFDDYIKYVYGQKSDKPWLLVILKTPYGGPDGDFNISLIQFKRIACVKKIWGDAVNVGFLDVFKNEYIRESFDPDISRMGAQAPMVVLIENGTVYHLKQANHEGKFLSRLIEFKEGWTQSEPIPYPVNQYTVYWEYIKHGVAYEKIFFGAIVKFLKKTAPDSPLLNRILIPYFIDGRLYTSKQAGRRIFFFFYVPCFIIISIVLYFCWLALKRFLCNRQTMANRHGKAAVKPTA